MQSPFGRVTGLEVRGTIETGQVETVKLIVELKSDSGLNSAYATIKPGGRSSVAWQGAGTLDYTVNTHNVDISVGYVHSRVDKHKIRLSIVLDFKPHGWVRLPETVLQLAGHNFPISFLIPQDVTEENLISAAKFTGICTDVERAYGKRLPDECRELVAKNTRKPEIRPTVADLRRSAETGVDPMVYAIERKRQRLDEYSTGSNVNSFSKQRLVAEKESHARITRLLDEWEMPVKEFLRRIFCSATRFRCIVQKWHNRRAIPFDAFIKALLHTRYALALTDTALHLFENSMVETDALSIPYTWMTTDEQTFCYRLYVNRMSLFADAADFNRSTEALPSSVATLASFAATTASAATGKGKGNGQPASYRLRRFLLDEYVVIPTLCGRFMVQQFVLDCIEYGLSSWHRFHVFVAVLSAVGKLHAAAGQNDAFLLNLKMAMERLSAWDAVNELGLLVSIAGSSPVYKVSREDIGLVSDKNAKQLPVISTPYRLA